jgi:hypothetical protein
MVVCVVVLGFELTLARQALYHLSQPFFVIFCLFVFDTGSHELFTQAGPEP